MYCRLPGYVWEMFDDAMDDDSDEGDRMDVCEWACVCVYFSVSLNVCAVRPLLPLVTKFFHLHIWGGCGQHTQ